jgi:hypothetical protein
VIGGLSSSTIYSAVIIQVDAVVNARTYRFCAPDLSSFVADHDEFFELQPSP